MLFPDLAVILFKSLGQNLNYAFFVRSTFTFAHFLKYLRYCEPPLLQVVPIL